MKKSSIVLPQNLALVIQHEPAIRALLEYVYEGGVESDMEKVHCDLREVVQAKLPELEGWKYVYEDGSSRWSSNKWGVLKENSIAIDISIVNPFDEAYDQTPSVNLVVPAKWRGAKVFTQKARDLRQKYLKGFIHISDPEAEGWDKEYVLTKYVEYKDNRDESGSLDTAKFTSALVTQIKRLLECEKYVDALIKASTPKKSVKAKS